MNVIIHTDNEKKLAAIAALQGDTYRRLSESSLASVYYLRCYTHEELSDLFVASPSGHTTAFEMRVPLLILPGMLLNN